mgnify:FL=1
MDNLKMHSLDGVQRNIDLIGKLFPNAITEVKRNGKVEHAIDFDVLRQELSDSIVEGREERYQFTWPDKKKAMLAANAPITATLRPVVADSVGKDGTPGGFDSENLYIEGDNLEVLKLLQETYLGKVKMIYIDPPYNTGNDFVYNDEFGMRSEEWDTTSGNYDEDGNQIVGKLELNTESNGRFHTDWLNMIYPRLKLAKDLLAEDGSVFVSIDDNERDNLEKICSEIFGADNYVATFPWRKRTAKSDVPFGVSQDYEWIVCFAKSNNFFARVNGTERKYFETPDFPNRPWRVHDLTTQRTASERPNSNFTMVNPKTGREYPVNPMRTWAVTRETFEQYYKENRIVFPDDYSFLNITKPAFRYWKADDEKKAGDLFGLMPLSTKLPDDIGMSLDGTKEITKLFSGKVFSYPKTVSLIKLFVDSSTKTDKEAVILDFFSGSATTAHAVMKLNAEDGGHRKFIMVQLPEKTDEKSEAYKAGYKNICEIGKERIRRAGKQILSAGGGQLEMSETQPEPGTPVDVGFRCLRLDSSNMENVYYTPEEISQQDLFSLVDNVKSDRTPEDLLFQVMLDLGVLLSSPIEVKEIAGKKVFNVADGFLLACFDHDVTEETVKAIAQMKPYYAVFRDSSMANDSVATNFDQIFETYSPETVRKVL